VRAKLLQEKQPRVEQKGLGFKLEKLQTALEEVRKEVDARKAKEGAPQ
jgi:glycerol uptake facilitator protein